jgi:SAM-dependent methyltransferase
VDVPVQALKPGEHQLALEYVSSGRREVLRSGTGVFTLHLDDKLPSADEEVHGLWGREMVIRRSAVGVAGLEAEGRLDQRSTRDAFRAMNSLYLLLKSSPYSSPWPTHISDEQWYPLIYKAFQASGLPLEEYECDPEGFERYLEVSKPLYAKHGYIDSYGGERGYFLEKAFEHYISWEYLRWGESERVLDLACWTSPASEVLLSFKKTDFYAHDITLKTDLKKKTISGFANAIEAPDSYFDAVVAHCAIDNFEGTADIDVFHEAARILKPGGRILIAPLHVAVRAENVIAPGYPGVELDEGAHLVLGNPGTMRFGRHYSADSLRKRLVQNVPELSFRVVHVRNLPTQAHPPTATCRFLLVGTRPS